MHIAIQNDPENDDQTLKEFWAIESSGTFPSDKSTGHSWTLICNIQSHAKTRDPIWLKKDHPTLPSGIQVKRSLVRRLADSPEIMKAYNQIIKELEKRGFIEKVVVDQIPSVDNMQSSTILTTSSCQKRI